MMSSLTCIHIVSRHIVCNPGTTLGSVGLRFKQEGLQTFVERLGAGSALRLLIDGYNLVHGTTLLLLAAMSVSQPLAAAVYASNFLTHQAQPAPEAVIVRNLCSHCNSAHQ